jgi:hypothetical protein
MAAGGYAVASEASGHGSSPAQSASQAVASSSRATTSTPLPATAPAVPGRGGRGNWSHPGFADFGRGGTLTKLGATTITVDTGFGGSLTVTTSTSTTYTESGKKAARSALAVGEQVMFRTTGPAAVPGKASSPSSSGPVTVASVEIVLPEVSGKVVSVNGSEVVVAQRNGLHVTVNTSGSTAYEQDGQAAVAADLKVGSAVSVTGTLSSDKTEIDATVVQIVLPSVAGRVTAVSGTTITITGFNGTETVTTGSSTTFRDESGKTTIASVAKGDFVQASGTPGSANSFAASAVYLAPSTSSGPTLPGGGGPGSFGPGHFKGRGGPGGPANWGSSSWPASPSAAPAGATTAL